MLQAVRIPFVATTVTIAVPLAVTFDEMEPFRFRNPQGVNRRIKLISAFAEQEF
jgi:hypothetical protein